VVLSRPGCVPLRSTPASMARDLEPSSRVSTPPRSPYPVAWQPTHCGRRSPSPSHATCAGLFFSCVQYCISLPGMHARTPLTCSAPVLSDKTGSTHLPPACSIRGWPADNPAASRLTATSIDRQPSARRGGCTAGRSAPQRCKGRQPDIR
jgi:hypothetical protein